jgi:hypothetical protein
MSNVWASTPNGNKRLDNAYRLAQERMAEKGTKCLISLFFSVSFILLTVPRELFYHNHHMNLKVVCVPVVSRHLFFFSAADCCSGAQFHIESAWQEGIYFLISLFYSKTTVHLINIAQVEGILFF